MIHSG